MFDLEDGNNFKRVMNTNATFGIINPPAFGKMGSCTLVLANAGSYSIIWPTSVVWSNNVTPTFKSISVSYVDVITLLTFNGGVRWYATVAIEKLPI